jgi:hypothetical protein
MTEEYFNPTKVIVAETMKRRMAGSIITGGARMDIEARSPSPLLPSRNESANAVEGGFGGILAMVERMTPTEREQLKALLGK